MPARSNQSVLFDLVKQSVLIEYKVIMTIFVLC